jgi:signal transduction histidine kinase
MSADEIGDLATALQALEQRVRRDEATAAAASERERIARELHDGAAKSVSALALEAASLRARGDPSLAHDLMRIEKLARDLSDELRAIVRDLRSRDDAQPFADVLRDCIVPHRGARLDVEPGIEAASPLVRYQVTRILSEALRNAEMHAKGSRVAVDVAAASDRLHVRVDDDGVGIPTVEWEQLVDDGHFGLMGMRERAQLLGGTLDVARSEMGGLRIVVDVPLRVTE